MIRDINILFEKQEEVFYEPIITLNMKVVATEIKIHQSKDTLIKLNPT